MRTESRYSIAAGSGEGVEVAGINEIENDGVNGAFAFLESVGDPVLPLLRRRQSSHHRLATQRNPSHHLTEFRFPSSVGARVLFVFETIISPVVDRKKSILFF